MRYYSGSRVTLYTLIGLAILALALAWLVISGSGVLRGGNGRGPVASAAEAAPQNAGIMDLAAGPWTAVVLVGTAVLGIVLALVQWRESRTTPKERALTEAATRALYEEENDTTPKE